MGGAAGHIQNIWEATDLTFRDLKEIIYKSLYGKLENVTEKLDGQNILITYKNKKVLTARSTKHLKNFGDTALDINELERYFEEKKSFPHVKNTFVSAIRDLQNALDKSNVDLSEIFQDGKNWLSVEILCVDTENIIPYNLNQLRIHHIRELDDKGKIIRLLENKKLDEIINNIKLDNNKFDIKKTNFLIFKNINDVDLFYKKFINEIEFLKSSAGLKDDDTIEDYFVFKLNEFIEYNVPGKINNELKYYLSNRWGKNNKEIPINIILKDKRGTHINWIRNTENNIKNILENLIEPFVEIFSKLGIIVLKNLDGIVVAEQQKAIEQIIYKLNISIEHINTTERTEDISKHIKNFYKFGGFDSVVPIEGIVFEFKNKLLKLTGNFSSILKIIGFYKFK